MPTIRAPAGSREDCGRRSGGRGRRTGRAAAAPATAVTAKPLLARPALVRTVKPARPPVGPSFDRRQCEILASGRISLVWGSQFAELDDIERLTRNPQGRLLLVDRITGIDAEARSMGTGTLWT